MRPPSRPERSSKSPRSMSSRTRRAEFSLTALVYNLRRVLNILGMDKMMAAIAT
jgi:hypothetical protein